MIQLATIPKVTKSAQIRNYVAANPKAKSAKVAEAVGVTPAYVATVMWNAKKKAKVVKKLGGMQKKKAMTNKELTDLSPALKFLEGRAQAVKMKGLWENIGIFSSDKSVAQQIEMFEPKSDPVNNPTHYTVGGIETIDFIEAKQLGYNLGNVIKYLTRADHKGNKLEDLRKAQWYLTREINSLK
jgi:hypothetical protein